MTGSSDGLIRFWENEGDALSIAKRNFSCFTAFIFVPYLGKTCFGLFAHNRKTYHLSIELDIVNCVTVYLLEPTNLV
jgi:hypothetical protein